MPHVCEVAALVAAVVENSPGVIDLAERVSGFNRCELLQGCVQSRTLTADRVSFLLVRGYQCVGRGLAGIFLVLAVLAPYLDGAFALSGSADQCSMACCKRAKTCCCRRSAQDSGAPQWNSAKACPPGCKRSPAVHASGTPAVLANQTACTKIEPHAPFVAACYTARYTAEKSAVLFERPPPIL